MTNDEVLKRYLSRPSKVGLIGVLRSYQKDIDGIAHNILGKHDSSIARRRAYLLASKAIKTYDPSKGIPFNKYLAVQLQPLRRMSKNLHEAISVPERHRRNLYLMNLKREELIEKLDREPSAEEIADATGLTPRQQASIMNSQRNVIPVSQYQRATATPDDPEGILPSIETPEDRRLKEVESYVYHDLDDVDKQIYNARKNSTLDNNTLAKNLNLSPGAVSQRYSKIEKRISEALL